MAEPNANPNQKLIRLAVLLAAAVAGIFIVSTVFQGSAPPPLTPAPGTAGTPGSQGKPAATQPAAIVAPAAPTDGAASPTTMPSEAGSASAPTSTQPSISAAAPAPPAAALHASSEPEARVATLGSLDPATGYRMEADLSAFGASVLEIKLTDYAVAALHKTHYPVQTAVLASGTTRKEFIFPMAARALYIDRRPVDLSVAAWKLETPSAYRTTRDRDPAAPLVGPFSEAVYSLTIVDAEDREIARVRRTYRLDPKSYALQTHQEIVNLTQRPMEIVWEQNGPGDLPNDDASYMGDHRSLVVGYYDMGYDPTRTHLYTEKGFFARAAVLDAKAAGTPTLWPNPALPPKAEPLWFASVNRYFAVAATPVVTPVAGAPTPEPWYGNSGSWAAADVHVTGVKGQTDDRQMVTVLTSRPIALAADSTARLDVNLYAGPRDPHILGADPWSFLHLKNVIVYQLGCTLCTFQPLAHGLLWFLNAIHSVTFDWGVSIIVLVIVVRACLHPLTRRSQIQMARLGKQMQAVQPELEKIKKKYADDQQRLNSEIMALYRAKGINPFNMLGCLPMFLQMPIWIALYAMLYYAIELRHQPAFYGVFQKISGGKWTFLADLSSADHFIQFAPHPITYNVFLLNYIDFSALNIIPMLMAVVFFVQQQYTMPPPANEQAAQQQKMMKWMSVLWPVLLYAAPSGLTLYILASTGAGIVDSYLVRRHIKQEEARGELFKPPKPGKPDGFFGKLMAKFSERAAQMMDEQQRKAEDRMDRRCGRTVCIVWCHM
ncbi:MAG: membrane protein insertase YidC [Planctomycetota bacterium]|nr:membrane protein insertase YidC [Planctomycetota bacterium]